MRNILRHWRKPAAGALLLLSLALFGMEMRSRVMHDALAFTDDARHQQLIVSSNDAFSIFIWEIADDENGVDIFDSMPADKNNSVTGFVARMRSRPSFTEIRIPYWCLILPPALIAGVLLIWKPRATPQ
jgi:hypothetical protein